MKHAGTNEPSNVSSGQVGSVHQTDTVHDSERHSETAINAVHDLALLGMSELSDAWISGFLVGVGMLQEVGIVGVCAITVDGVLLSILARHSSWAVIVVHVVLEVRHCN